MIRSFGDEETKRVWTGGRSRKLPPNIQPTGLRKMRILNRVTSPLELCEPKGNRLEELKGDRKGT